MMDTNISMAMTIHRVLCRRMYHLGYPSQAGFRPNILTEVPAKPETLAKLGVPTKSETLAKLGVPADLAEPELVPLRKATIWIG